MEKLRLQPHQTDGKLITFCGLDGCGKTTIINMLQEYLREHDIETCLTKQPTKEMRQSPVFRTFMDKEDNSDFHYIGLSLMAASDRVQHTNNVILPQMQAGKTIISDRYFYSCLANLCARGYTDSKWIYEVSEYIVQPDLAFFLDINVDTAIKRVRSREEEKNRYIDIELQHRLCLEYKRIAALNGGISINSEQKAEDTFKIIKNEVDKLYGFDGGRVWARAI